MRQPGFAILVEGDRYLRRTQPHADRLEDHLGGDSQDWETRPMRSRASVVMPRIAMDVAEAAALEHVEHPRVIGVPKHWCRRGIAPGLDRFPPAGTHGKLIAGAQRVDEWLEQAES